jgi:hypothetical protein
VTNESKHKFWSAIDAAWAHKDGDGFSLKLDYLPLIPGPQIVMRKPKAEEAEAPAVDAVAVRIAPQGAASSDANGA